MIICDDNHREIVYEVLGDDDNTPFAEYECPLCFALERIRELERELDNFRKGGQRQ